MLTYDENKFPVIELGDGCVVRLETDDLTENEREKAETELRETEEIKKASLKEFILLLSGRIQ